MEIPRQLALQRREQGDGLGNAAHTSENDSWRFNAGVTLATTSKPDVGVKGGAAYVFN